MAQEMSFAQALNEAKGVILQLSNRVKSDAEKIRSQQQTIVEQASSLEQKEGAIAEQAASHSQELAFIAGTHVEEIAAINARHAEEIAALTERVKQAEAAGAHAEAILNRQGEKILQLESANAELEKRIGEFTSQIEAISAERDAVKSQLPSDEDSAALASMAQLLIKAGPAIEKAKKSGPGMRLSEESVAEAA